MRRGRFGDGARLQLRRDWGGSHWVETAGGGGGGSRAGRGFTGGRGRADGKHAYHRAQNTPQTECPRTRVCYQVAVRSLPLVAAVLLACGGGAASGSGAGSPTDTTPTADDTDVQSAVDFAVGVAIAAYAQNVCQSSTTCGALGSYDPEELPHAPTEHHDATWAVSHLGDADPNDALVAVVESSDPSPALPAVRELARRGRHRVVALGVLGLAGDVEALPILAAALDDPSPAIRRAAIFALGRLGPRVPTMLPALRTLAESGEDVVDRCRAADAATAIGGERVTPTLLRDPDDLIPIGAAPPDAACAGVGRALCTTDVVPLGDLCAVGLHRSDDVVAMFPRQDFETAPHGTRIDGAPTDPIQLVAVGDVVVLLSGRAGHGAVHRIVPGDSGRMKAEAIAAFESVPKWYRADGSTLVVQTEDQRNHRVMVPR